MNGKKNFLYSILSNLLSTLTSAIITLLLPKVISVEGYGYFQLFLLWTGYVGILHFGWLDGLYLKLCGMEYEQLEKKAYAAQVKAFLGVQIGISLVCIIFVCLFTSESYRYVYWGVCITAFVLNSRLLFSYILQATYRIKGYVCSSICGTLIYMLLVVCSIIFSVEDYRVYIFTNIAGNAVALIIGAFLCKDIVLSSGRWDKKVLWEIKDNIFIGVKILVANFSGILTTGIVRWSIEKQWGLVVFGKVSMTLTISNMFMTFINAIATVLLPMLKRMKKEQLPSLYGSINTILISVICGLMFFYYPAEKILVVWLPEYAEGLKYMAILFPICIFESKNALLLVTYLKAFRKEKAIMQINMFTVLVSLSLTGFSVFIVKNLDLTMVMIVLILALRCIITELYLARVLNITLRKIVFEEIALTVLFIFLNWFIGGMLGIGCYGLIYVIYIYINRKDLSKAFSLMHHA